MVGLGRIQQRFNAAVVSVLTLAGLARMAGKAEGARQQASVGFGHPYHRKVLKGKLDGCPAGLHLTHRKHCAHYVAPTVAQRAGKIRGWLSRVAGL